jgi:hypothetical protein
MSIFEKSRGLFVFKSFFKGVIGPLYKSLRPGSKLIMGSAEQSCRDFFEAKNAVFRNPGHF